MIIEWMLLIRRFSPLLICGLRGTIEVRPHFWPPEELKLEEDEEPKELKEFCDKFIKELFT